jgi:CRP-like cAMP-binding protein
MDNDVLRQAPLFSNLDDEAARSLGSSMSETKLNRGEVLFREGDTGDRLYVVTEGKIKLGRTSADGRENLLAILGPGQMFGELSHWLDTRPDVARGLLNQLAGRLRRANDVVADLVFSDVPGRGRTTTARRTSVPDRGSRAGSPGRRPRCDRA